VSVQNCGTAHFMISRRVLTFVSNPPAFFGINVLVCAFQPTWSSTVIQSHLLLSLLRRSSCSSYFKYTALQPHLPSQCHHKAFGERSAAQRTRLAAIPRVEASG